jgi:LysR family glycine cleavage system transcriptional activator
MDWSEIPSLSALRAFEAAARHQSLSKAAAELNVTHAAIAQHVRALEADFSESLLVKRGRGVVTTPAGNDLAGYLSEGFMTVADGVRRLREMREGRPLNISVTPMFASNWLIPRMGEFWAEHPEVTININPSSDIVDLRRDGFDLCIRFGEGTWPGHQVELLTDGDYWVLGAPELLGDRTVNCLADVADLPWLLEGHMMERRALIEREGVQLKDIRHTLLSTNSMVLSGAFAGLGIVVQAKSLVEREVARGKLVKICELRQENLGYYILTLPDRHPKGLATFLRWLRTKKDQ